MDTYLGNKDNTPYLYSYICWTCTDIQLHVYPTLFVEQVDFLCVLLNFLDFVIPKYMYMNKQINFVIVIRSIIHRYILSCR